jgi:hypothetical protein
MLLMYRAAVASARAYGGLLVVIARYRVPHDPEITGDGVAGNS